MPTIAAEPGIETVADILHRLGGVSPDRVLWHPTPGTATEADVFRYATGRRKLLELIDGVLVEKDMGYHQSVLATLLTCYLYQFVSPRRLGVVAGADAHTRFASGLIRLPDASFTRWETLPSDDAHLRSVAEYAPDLAVEVLSPRNTPSMIARKRREYFAGGTKLVWIIDPDARTVAVYTDPDTHTVLTEADTLTGGTVLSGFALPLTELFNDPQLNPRP